MVWTKKLTKQVSDHFRKISRPPPPTADEIERAQRHNAMLEKLAKDLSPDELAAMRHKLCNIRHKYSGVSESGENLQFETHPGMMFAVAILKSQSPISTPFIYKELLASDKIEAKFYFADSGNQVIKIGQNEKKEGCVTEVIEISRIEDAPDHPEKESEVELQPEGGS